MWRKHCSLFQDHVKYIHNDIVKHSRVRILQYAELDREMNDLAKYLTPPQMKSVRFESDRWDICDNEFSEHIIRVETKDALPTYMKDQLEYNNQDDRSILHEDWCDLISTVEVKDNRKRVATQIKRFSTSKQASNYDINESVRAPRNERVRTGFLTNFKQQSKICQIIMGRRVTT